MDEKKSSQLQRVIMPSNWLLVVSYLVQRFHPIATQAHVLDFGLNSSTCTTIPPSKLGIFPSHPKTLNVCHMQNIKNYIYPLSAQIESSSMPKYSHMFHQLHVQDVPKEGVSYIMSHVTPFIPTSTYVTTLCMHYVIISLKI
jgi:hypothetical protein